MSRSDKEVIVSILEKQFDATKDLNERVRTLERDLEKTIILVTKLTDIMIDNELKENK